jgi:hypothetical protein
MSKTTTLGETQVTPSLHDTVTIQLIQPADLPPIVQVAWPLQPSVIDPENFGDTAAALVKMLSTAHVELARIKARRYLS